MSTKKITRHQTALTITVLGLVMDLVLTAAKLVTGFLINSNALIADAIHSLSDAATDVMVIAVSYFSNHEPDHNHPYGHGRYETVGTIALGAVLATVALGIGYDAIKTLKSPPLITATPLAFGVAIASVILKEWQYRFTLRAGESINSTLLKANAWHSRSDALSSAVVVAGLIGVALGFAWVDGVAALIIALIILQVGAAMVWNALKELVDTMPISLKEGEHLLNHIKSLDGVIDAHCLRSRQMGPHQAVDLHVQVNPRVSVSEGHYISDKVIEIVHEYHPNITDLVVHIDAEDDDSREVMQRNLALPSRASISDWLQAHAIDYPWLSEISEFTLHYLQGKLHIDCFLSKSSDTNHPPILQKQESLHTLWSSTFGGDLRLFTHQHPSVE